MDISGIGLTAIFNRCGASDSSGSGNLDEATRRLIGDKDKDGNGTLSAVEISISAEAFKLADTNADGELDADELKNSVDIIGKELAAQGLPPAPRDLEQGTEQLVQDLDKDGDGALNASELPISSEVFDSADTDKDGVLSLDELRAASKEIGAELRAKDDATKHRSILDFFRSGSDDSTKTTLDQTA